MFILVCKFTYYEADMKTTIKDVANYAGVSIATVSRVINNNGYISKATYDKVLTAIKASGYIIPAKKQENKRMKTHVVNVILPYLSNPFYAELFEKITHSLNLLGYDAILTIENNRNHDLDFYINDLIKGKVDGIIVSSHLLFSSNKDYSKLPIVSFDRTYAGITKVRSNNTEGAAKIAKKVLSMGKRNILIISSDKKDLYPINDRIKGLIKEFNKYHATVKATYLDFNNSLTAKRIAIAQTITSKKYDAICCTDDVTALLTQQYVNTINYHPIITGFDGTDLIHNLFPNLISIRQPIDDIADLLAEIINKKILHPSKKFNEIYEVPVTLLG